MFYGVFCGLCNERRRYSRGAVQSSLSVFKVATLLIRSYCGVDGADVSVSCVIDGAGKVNKYCYK